MTGNAGSRDRNVASAALLFGLVLSVPLRAQTMEEEAVATAAFVTPDAPAVLTPLEKALEPAPIPLSHSGPAPMPVAVEPKAAQAVAAGASEGVDPVATPVVTTVAPPVDAAPVATASPPAEAENNLLARSAERIASGLASWYGPRFHGRRTANGERYNMHELTAAHKTLPFGTRLRVRSVHTGKEVVVRVNDRGPYKHNRIIDLSLAAMTALGLRERGVSAVELLRE
jgi:rare lipoprotein A